MESDVVVPSSSSAIQESTLKEEVKVDDDDGSIEKQVNISSNAATGAQQQQQQQQMILVNDDNHDQGTLSINDFRNNDTKILALLNEAGSNYSFKGLMRKLNMHQQSLTRALHRLEDMGLVEKSDIGYRLSKDGEIALSKVGISQRIPRGREYVQLLQTYIPHAIKAGEVMRYLAGRWFKNLRWIGMIESGTAGGSCYTLQWASDDSNSFQVNLRLISDYVIIETNASTEEEKVKAMIGSYAIYEQIIKLFQSRIGAFVLEQRQHHNDENNNMMPLMGMNS